MADLIRIGGEHNKTGKKTKYALIIEDFVSTLVPPVGIDLPIFDPYKYFITSGDAISKTKVMSKDLWEYAGKARKAINALGKKACKYSKKFEKKCWESAGGATLLINALKDAKGDAVFMEVEWGGHIDDDDEGYTLCVTPKRPRKKI